MLHEQIGDYIILRNPRLGQGATGSVYYGQHAKENYKVAMKEIDINKITPAIERQIENEITNLAKLKSPFIVKLYDYFRYNSYLCLFLEYCEDGDLRTFLHKKRGEVCQSQAVRFMRHLIMGYRQLHNNNIIHRDIKPANILLKQGIAKLSDFGFSRVVSNPDTEQKLTLLGTPIYTAIQILQGHQFSSKCDVWSMGVVLYEMLHSKTPWSAKDLDDLRKNILTKPLEVKQTKEFPQLSQIIRRMLALDSKERISWNEIFSLEIFQSDKAPITMDLDAEGHDYMDYKTQFLQYLRQMVFKSYLRFNTAQVKFTQSPNPSQKQLKQAIDAITLDITHQRNVAFLYAYMARLYYKSINVMPPTVNQFMELEYCLVAKCHKGINAIGRKYFAGQPPGNALNWEAFSISAEFEELKLIITQDYKVLEKFRKHIKKEAERKFKAKLLGPQTFQYFNGFEKSFEEYFTTALTSNYKELIKVKKEACSLLANYIQDYALNENYLVESKNIDYGVFYENRELQYGVMLER